MTTTACRFPLIKQTCEDHFPILRRVMEFLPPKELVDLHIHCPWLRNLLNRTNGNFGRDIELIFNPLFSHLIPSRAPQDSLFLRVSMKIHFLASKSNLALAPISETDRELLIAIDQINGDEHPWEAYILAFMEAINHNKLDFIQYFLFLHPQSVKLKERENLSQLSTFLEVAVGLRRDRRILELFLKKFEEIYAEGNPSQTLDAYRPIIESLCKIFRYYNANQDHVAIRLIFESPFSELFEDIIDDQRDYPILCKSFAILSNKEFKEGTGLILDHPAANIIPVIGVGFTLHHIFVTALDLQEIEVLKKLVENDKFLTLLSRKGFDPFGFFYKQRKCPSISTLTTLVNHMQAHSGLENFLIALLKIVLVSNETQVLELARAIFAHPNAKNIPQNMIAAGLKYCMDHEKREIEALIRKHYS